MGWKEEMLEEILILLVLFADLADRVAGRPLAIALPVLAGLTRAEAVARGYLVGLPSGASARVAVSRAQDRAERLAADFRMLARILRAYLAKARRQARFATREIARQADPSLPSCRSRCPDACPAAAPRAPDTS
jgi:hypothetical protein